MLSVPVLAIQLAVAFASSRTSDLGFAPCVCFSTSFPLLLLRILCQRLNCLEHVRRVRSWPPPRSFVAALMPHRHAPAKGFSGLVPKTYLLLRTLSSHGGLMKELKST